jgi:cytidylate kinase
MPHSKKDKDQDKGRDLVIAISGQHGAGRSTHARCLAKELGLRYFSTGRAFREMAESRGLSLEEMSLLAERGDELDSYLDKKAKEESKRGGVVIDATLSAWIAEEPDLKIFLWAPFEERVKRIAEREDRTLDEVRRETRMREESEEERFLNYYYIDVTDLKIYDVVLNTSLFPPEGTARILKKIVEEYKKAG